MAKRKKPAKTAKKTAPKKKPAKRTPAHGKGALYVGGVPGNKGGGRLPDEFKAMMREIASSPEAIARLKSLAAPPVPGEGGRYTDDDSAFQKAFREAADRGYGRPVQPHELGGPDGGPIPIADVSGLRKRVAGDLARIAARIEAPGIPAGADG